MAGTLETAPPTFPGLRRARLARIQDACPMQGAVDCCSNTRAAGRRARTLPRHVAPTPAAGNGWCAACSNGPRRRDAAAPGAGRHHRHRQRRGIRQRELDWKWWSRAQAPGRAWPSPPTTRLDSRYPVRQRAPACRPGARVTIRCTVTPARAAADHFNDNVVFAGKQPRCFEPYLYTRELAAPGWGCPLHDRCWRRMAGIVLLPSQQGAAFRLSLPAGVGAAVCFAVFCRLG